MVKIIGGAINTSREGFSEIVRGRHREAVLNEASFAAHCGAAWISLNCSSCLNTEVEDLCWLAGVIQDELELPLCIDSLNQEAVERVLSIHRHGRPIIDSLSCEEARLDTFLPLMKKYDALGICLMMGDGKIAYEVEERLACLLPLKRKMEMYGVTAGDVLLDPLVFALATGEAFGQLFLNTLRAVKAQEPEFLTCCGLDNISHGLPLRDRINEAFLLNCMIAGIDAVMMIPTKTLHSFIKIQEMIEGHGDGCMDFIRGFRAGYME